MNKGKVGEVYNIGGHNEKTNLEITHLILDKMGKDENSIEYVKEFNDVVDISRMFLADFFKGINSFDYIEEISTINLDYTNQILKNVFKEDKMVLSVIKS